MKSFLCNGFNRVDFMFEGGEESGVFESYYGENEGAIVAVGKENRGHHLHGFADSTPIVNLVERYCK